MQPDSDLDIRRKRTFFTYSNSVLGLVFIGLGWLNYMDGMIPDFKLNVFLVALAAGSMLALKYLSADMTIYRVTYFIVCILFFLSIQVGIGKDTILYYVFPMPPLLFFYFGKREGMIWILFFIGGISAVFLTLSIFNRNNFYYFNISRFYITISIVILTSYGIESARHTYSKMLNEKNKALFEENLRLELALKEIKTLSGLIPICASCKKIRNDQGYWQQVETYFKEHSKAKFSHSVCPDCVKILYPEYEPEKKIK